MRRILPPTLVLVLASAAAANVDLTPRVGASFEYFGNTWRLSDDQDTVATVSDYGSMVGLTVKNPGGNSRFRLDTDLLLGKETRRVRLDFDGRIRFGENGLQLEHDGLYRRFNDTSSYASSSNYVQEYVRLTYDRDFGQKARLRLRDTFDGTWYETPDEYNLSYWMHRPSAEVRVRFGDLSEARVGYRWGTRSVPDSASLGYTRHTVDTGLNLLFGWTGSLDVYDQLERRSYEAGSVRESSWENRFDARLELSGGERATFRLLHENEIVRFDSPDDLDFDFDYARTGFQVEVHQTSGIDLTIMPLYAFLTNSTAPEEEYAEVGVELGTDWRVFSSTWINFAYEVGRRDYEISVSGEDEIVDITDLPPESTDVVFESVFSDYLYHRFTLIVSSDVTRGVSLNLFANWQPEDHRVSRHDTNTRIVSGGLEYRF